MHAHAARVFRGVACHTVGNAPLAFMPQPDCCEPVTFIGAGLRGSTRVYTWEHAS